jgi:hypothetical protein
MTPRRRIFRLASIVVSLILLGGCALHMPISEDLASGSQQMSVKRKNSMLANRVKFLSFGPYRVEEIHLHGTPTDRKGSFGHAKLKAETRYDFRISQGGTSPWACDCVNHAEREDYFPLLGRSKELGYHVSLECNLAPAGGGTTWAMTLAEDDSSGNILRGSLTDGTRLVEVTGTHALQGRKTLSEGHTGFQFHDISGTLGAVELLGKQRVLMQSNSNDEIRHLMAAASATLLLYEDLNQRMKEEMRNKSGYGIQMVSLDPPVQTHHD